MSINLLLPLFVDLSLVRSQPCHCISTMIMKFISPSGRGLVKWFPSYLAITRRTLWNLSDNCGCVKRDDLRVVEVLRDNSPEFDLSWLWMSWA